jgi:hypothetical protein
MASTWRAHVAIVRLLLATVACGPAAVWSPATALATRPLPDVVTRQSSCAFSPTQPMTQISDKGLTEASGLAASRRWPGIYWTVTDAHNPPDLFAFNQQGQSLGTFRVSGASNVDWEAVQVGPDGNGQSALYVADTGDNDEKRRFAVVYRLPEPDPMSAGHGTRSTAHATALRFVYPSGPRNVEALLVHPVTGEMLLITKNYRGYSEIYRAPTWASSDRLSTLELIGHLDVSWLGSNGNLVTDASVTPDARHVVVRTYSSALVYDLAEGATLASIWSQSPMVQRLNDGEKGEGITYKVGSYDLLSIGEGARPTLYQTRWECVVAASDES